MSIAADQHSAYDAYLRLVAEDYEYQVAWVASGGAIKGESNGQPVHGRAYTFEEWLAQDGRDWGTVREFDVVRAKVPV